MKIIELTEVQFRNYSKLHSARNYFQTVEYAHTRSEVTYYLGYNNESDNTFKGYTETKKSEDLALTEDEKENNFRTIEALRLNFNVNEDEEEYNSEEVKKEDSKGNTKRNVHSNKSN